ncbi:alpha/beta fold hydrolase [Noviherbaspirillum galbum]|uniref:Alpha/beta hydrolase n=1 Tax=Noviherbaspirillum galbum TaxID=2709383 RepID=A0A6B3SQ88_9BURK|nr:alpha/beta hydrolase [Noviherbaspirillum galbum]
MLDAFRREQVDVNGVTIHVRHGGSGPALLLLHGFPQTHVIWHKLADRLAQRFTLVMPDLRGYGDSSKPPGDARHMQYAKRTMARDMAELMTALGHERFQVCGHDRGARVAHRLALDHTDRVDRLMVVDISPTRTMYEATDMRFATLYYHWFLLIQPAPVPETLIGNSAAFYLNTILGGWGSQGLDYIDPEARAEYERCFCTPEAIHGACEDYRAAATIDLEHDRDDDNMKIRCPTRVVWGERGIVGRYFKPLQDWQEKCEQPVTGKALPAGHFIPEEAPEPLLAEMLDFFQA